MKWSQMREVMRARKAGASLGDIAVMKFAMYSGPAPRLNARLKELGYPACLEVDMDEMRRLPEGTVGRAFARHLDDHGLDPLHISDECKRRYADNPVALRYTTTHDLFHVITGFSTTPAGELGLFAFMIGQGFAGGGPAALRLARWVYTVLMPTHARGAWHNVRVGRALGERAANLLEQPLERFLREPLIDVRRRLGLPETPEQGDIAPGHDSLLAKWLTPKPRAMPAASAA